MSAKNRKAADRSAEKEKSLESWIWDAACSIRRAKDAPKCKEFSRPLIFAKRLCDVFDEDLDDDLLSNLIEAISASLPCISNQLIP